ncbi:nuclease-related domain-containing protein [Phycicoccus sp. Root101]|uniref:nuclease-related domain-containing protein n=1 Tax=Phycicoccus sp. Root101 TaxID=1736421 RepID=UPI0009EC5A25|nr:nuclease-related domain-containing protein [Phycicoccus sp. Root101]
MKPHLSVELEPKDAHRARRGGTIAAVGSPGGSADEHAKQLIDEAGKWAAGAEGERRVAAALESLPSGWTVVHDRLLRPGRSEANLDHIAVGPTGIFLIDAKNRAGRVTEHEGGLFQHRVREGRTETVSLAAELKKVHGMAAYMAAEADRPVTPVLCLAGSRAAEFGEPRMVRGVWVVPVTALAGWLRARPAVMTSEDVPSVATRVITDFPSTTTDPTLLAAMAAAATSGKAQARHSTRTPRPVRPGPARSLPTRQPRRVPRFVRKLVRLTLGLLVLAASVLFLAKLPAILTAGVERLAGSGNPPAATAGPAGTAPDASVATAKSSQPKATKPGAATPKPAKPSSSKPKAAPKPLGPPDCADASAAEVKAVIHRTVHPVVTSQGCAWGTRLDDPSTVLVTINVFSSHEAWDTNLATSAKQKRVVFSGGYDAAYRPATTVTVAAGQPILQGSKPVRARSDIVVKVATDKLGISDDRARAMAVAIAARANG